MDEPRCKECDYDLCDRCAARRLAGGAAAGGAVCRLLDACQNWSIVTRAHVPRQVNDEGAAVAHGRDRAYAERFYCGRRLGRDAIPGSDGQCGPSNVSLPSASGSCTRANSPWAWFRATWSHRRFRNRDA